jgi:2-haloacid dehalogenase
MSALDLTKYKVLTFYCYGTLIDWEAGIKKAFLDVGFGESELGVVLEKFGQVETVHQKQKPTALYQQILADVIREIGIFFNKNLTEDQIIHFSKAIREWPAFADSPQALADLQKHYKLVVVSNVDHESFSYSQKKLIQFDKLVLAQDVGDWKPSTKNFEVALAAIKKDFDVDPAQVLHVFQSLYHDCMPAKKMGLNTVWINRRRGQEGNGATPPPPEGAIPDLEFVSMKEFASNVSSAFSK